VRGKKTDRRRARAAASSASGPVLRLGEGAGARNILPRASYKVAVDEEKRSPRGSFRGGRIGAQGREHSARNKPKITRKGFSVR